MRAFRRRTGTYNNILSGIDPDQPFELAEIRETVEREWYAAHKKELKESIYKKLRTKYTIVFEPLKEVDAPRQNRSDAQTASEKQE